METSETSVFSNFIATQLNKEQRDAVLQVGGPTLVIAGAGSGKTRVITARIAHLMLEHNVPGSAIVALTFTNKAAREMKERVHSFVGNRESLPFISTFHAYCLAMLRKNGHLLSSPFETILDEDDRTSLVGTIIKRASLPKEYTARSVGFLISQAKNGFWGELAAAEYYHTNQTIREIHTIYEQEKRKSHALDFDDLLLETAHLFEKNPAFRATHHNRIRHLLVDEYQDTNTVQHALLKYMALDTSNTFAIDSLCAVGDEDQSIYSWRGATVENIRNFKNDFKGTTLIKVEQNYRSVQPILEAANNVVQNNSRRTAKNLWSEKKGTDRVRHLVCFSEYQEAEMIAQAIKAYRMLKSDATIAVLYRTHYQSRAIEEAMLKHALAYQIIGGVQFYERKEIKDILGYARLAVNPFDRASFFRVINTPTRGLGATFEEDFYNAWQREPLVDYRHIIQTIAPTQPKAKSAAINAFATVLAGIEPQQSAGEALENIVMKIGYFNYLKENYDTEDAVNRIDNVKELLNAARHSDEQGKNLATFLDEIALMQDLINRQKDTPHASTLMSLHAAKGLEFSLVIIAGLEDGLMPSIRSDDDYTNKLEEERRLFYVGMTRAQDYLMVTRARYRNHYRATSDQMPSRFLEEIPSTLIKTDDASHWQTVHAQNHFRGWFSNSRAGSPSITTSVLTFSQATPAARPAAKALPKKTVVSAASTSGTTSWKKNQPVQHATFGVGIIEQVEEKNSLVVHVTVQFKTGTKKLDARFIKPI